VLMVDGQSRRALLFRGRDVVQTFSPDHPLLIASRGMVLGADSSLRVITVSSVPLDRAPSETDSVTLVRWSFRSGVLDTVAKLGPSATRVSASGDAGGRPAMIRFSTPVLAVEETPHLFPDGWLAVARLNPYRIDWRRPDGTWVQGSPLPFREIPLDERERQIHRQRRSLLGQPVPSERAEWAVVIPPFPSSQPFPALIPLPNGNLLVTRNPPANELLNRYDVVNRAGRLVAELYLEANRRVVSVGSRGVYVVSVSDDGIESISRHPLPPAFVANQP
jgi:hypothetical protein